MNRIFVIDDKYCINVDNDKDAENLKKQGLKEVTKEKVAEIFGDYSAYAGPENTSIDEKGNILFDSSGLDIINDEGQSIRFTRDELLKACDYIIMPDYPISDAKKQEWVSYRQALRDIPEQSGFPKNITWPEKPEDQENGKK